MRPLNLTATPLPRHTACVLVFPVHPMRWKLPPLHRRVNEYMFRRAIASASWITTDTIERAEDIIDAGYPEEQVTVIPGGYDPADFEQLEQEEREERYLYNASSEQFFHKSIQKDKQRKKQNKKICCARSALL